MHLSSRIIRICRDARDVHGWVPERIHAWLREYGVDVPLEPIRRELSGTRAERRRNVLTDDDVRAIRMAKAQGESLRQLAGKYGIYPSQVQRIATGQMYAKVPREQAELDLLYANGRAECNEVAVPVNTGTGRIIGPDGTVYATIGKAEIATGIDRIVIARALLVGTLWKYEQGSKEPVVFANYGTTVERAKLYRK